MPQYNLLDTDTVTLNKIFKSGNYKVPDFQRDYSWELEQWEDLWDDIQTIRDDENPVHYMGAIVLQDLKDKTLNVIDGQQRLATLSLIALAIIKRIKDLVDNGFEVDDNEERIKDLMATYIGKKDAVSLHYSNKLKLNENNEWFYSKNLVHFEEPINKRKLNPSNKLLKDAFEFFTEKIKETFAPNPNGKELANFLQNQIAEKLAFIQIVVKDDLDAYIVFETLNSRGIELGISDLLKNYLFSLTADSDADKKQVKEQWKRITQIITLNEFPVFLRFFWASRYETVRKEHLYKKLRNSITSKEEAFSLLTDLEKYVNIYAALKNPKDDLWDDRKEARRKVVELKLFGVRQSFPLLMISFFKLSHSDFETVLRFCSIIAFRYNVIGGLDPKKQESVFHNTARMIYKGEIKTIKQIANELKSIYPNDERFINSFSTKQIVTKNNGLAKYILFSIEHQLTGNESNFESESGTVEHILPENPSADWDKSFPKAEQSNYVYRLGNLTLLESKKNNECGVKVYDEKNIIYQTSKYKITTNITYSNWTPQEVKKRQIELAKIGTAYWRISQLSI